MLFGYKNRAVRWLSAEEKSIGQDAVSKLQEMNLSLQVGTKYSLVLPTANCRTPQPIQMVKFETGVRALAEPPHAGVSAGLEAFLGKEAKRSKKEGDSGTERGERGANCCSEDGNLLQRTKRHQVRNAKSRCTERRRPQKIEGRKQEIMEVCVGTHLSVTSSSVCHDSTLSSCWCGF